MIAKGIALSQMKSDYAKRYRINTKCTILYYQKRPHINTKGIPSTQKLHYHERLHFTDDHKTYHIITKGIT